MEILVKGIAQPYPAQNILAALRGANFGQENRHRLLKVDATKSSLSGLRWPKLPVPVRYYNFSSKL